MEAYVRDRKDGTRFDHHENGSSIRVKLFRRAELQMSVDDVVQITVTSSISEPFMPDRHEGNIR